MKKWNVEDHLSTDKDMVRYLNVVLDEGDDLDRTLAIKAVISVLQARQEAAALPAKSA